jgi:hypothetical protein
MSTLVSGRIPPRFAGDLTRHHGRLRLERISRVLGEN